jgi:uncharacterized protein YhhL (DUF1145 family)
MRVPETKTNPLRVTTRDKDYWPLRVSPETRLPASGTKERLHSSLGSQPGVSERLNTLLFGSVFLGCFQKSEPLEVSERLNTLLFGSVFLGCLQKSEPLEVSERLNTPLFGSVVLGCLTKSEPSKVEGELALDVGVHHHFSCT